MPSGQRRPDDHSPQCHRRLCGASDGECSMSAHAYLVHEMETGALDGWYHGLDVARGALRSLQETYPCGRWALLRLIEVEGGYRIPDQRWWWNALKDENGMAGAR